MMYSDDGGASWVAGQKMVLLPQYGGGWTECQVAELSNGSVLLTSRNLFAPTSGQGPRLMARSDDGGTPNLNPNPNPNPNPSPSPSPSRSPKP